MKLYLGLGIAGPFAPLAPLILLTASGLVIAIWWILMGFKWLLRPVGRVFVARWGVCADFIAGLILKILYFIGVTKAWVWDDPLPSPRASSL